jgi:hypothetical protein
VWRFALQSGMPDGRDGIIEVGQSAQGEQVV